MGRYHFDIVMSGETIRDEEGQDYESLEAARDDAMRTAKELTAEFLRSGERLASAMETKLEARDEDGLVAFTLPFAMAVNAADFAS